MEKTQTNTELQELRKKIGEFIIGKADWLMFRQVSCIKSKGGRLTYYGLKYTRTSPGGEKEAVLLYYLDGGTSEEEYRTKPLNQCEDVEVLKEILKELVSFNSHYTAPYNLYTSTEEEHIAYNVKQIEAAADTIKRQVTEIVKKYRHIQTDPIHICDECYCRRMEWKDGEVVLHTGYGAWRLSEYKSMDTIYNIGKVIAEGKYQQFQGNTQ